MTKKLVATTVIFLMALVIGPSSAWSVGGQCADCHTMHDSQGGAAVAVGGPHDRLISATYSSTNPCLGCHGGDDYQSGDATPYVLGTNLLESDDLAGGNFAYHATGDAYVHNVLGSSVDDDATLAAVPPGYDSLNYPDPDAFVRYTGGTTTRLQCAGTYGCHGNATNSDPYDAISGAHHGNASGTLTTADTVGNSYRFLYGVMGIEDSDWENTADDADHNQYHGIHRTDDVSPDSATISYLCCQCHGDFHEAGASGGSPWTRHPTDFDLSEATGTEYASYNADNSYSIIAPVASDVTTDGEVEAVVLDESGEYDAIVTCLSCHRAHGSAYPDLLRWDYSAIDAGGGDGNVGCFICHTTKD
ncbi:MAG: cytochrome c3 family protein [Deltaproteobacteria bacterium]|nr:cytochrome c3 family protein [Candidatus Anaeroferrophillus wilburensis]MBN2887841.1 cytochrome c3 family protein [Deltaproteobacteria bacterium]